MKKELTIHIPEPCHEDWQQMTPVDKGRFCQSCAKQVVDFSLMTDQQVLNYIANANGRLCGRFASDQLQRPLHPVKPEKKKMWWMAAILPLMMLVEKVGAQKKKIYKNKQLIVSQPYQLTGIVGISENIYGTVKDTREIKGSVVDDKGAYLPFASVRVVGQALSTIADSAGNFTLKLHTYADNIYVEASLIGYEMESVPVNGNENNNISLVLKQTEFKLPDVVVKSDPLESLTGMVGAFSVVRTYTEVEKTDTLIRKIFQAEQFKIYPNPAQRGQSITIDTKKEGRYSIQLFDNNGKFLQVKEFDASEGATQTPFNIPSAAAPGIYYIRLVDHKTRKQVSDKIVVL